MLLMRFFSWHHASYLRQSIFFFRDRVIPDRCPITANWLSNHALFARTKQRRSDNQGKTGNNNEDHVLLLMELPHQHEPPSMVRLTF